MFLKTNNYAAIVNIAINLLEIPITTKDVGDFGIVYHPFFNSTYVVYDEKLIDIFKEKDKFNKYVQQLKEHIQTLNDVYKIVTLVNKPYRILYLYLIQDYLNPKTFANLLKDCYTETEYPNKDVNVSVEKIKAMFESADKNLIMDNNEKNIYNNLDNEVTIYRGFFSNKYYKALSWTLDFEKAKFFATRFNNTNGCIYQANIKKDDILAYFDCRNEKEIIADFDKLYNLKQLNIESKKQAI